MANNTIRRSWNMYSMVNIEDLRGSAFQAEDGGHTFEITGLDANGNATAISGTVAAVFLRPDNTDVAIAGSVSNGKAYVTLTDECYGYPGRFGLTIFLTSGGQKVAIYSAIGSVHRTSSGAVSPETAQDVVDLINEIEAAIAQIPASYADVMAAIAPPYSNTALYADGAYAWHEGKLYISIVPITTAESWNSAHWKLADIGSGVSELNLAFTDSITGTDDYTATTFTKTAGVVNIYGDVQLESNDIYKHFVIPVNYGDVIYWKTTKMAVGYPAYGFYDGSSNFFGYFDSGNSSGTESGTVIVPFNAAYMSLNVDMQGQYDLLKKDYTFSEYAKKPKEWTEYTGTPIAGIVGTITRGATYEVQYATVANFKHLKIPVTYADNGKLKVLHSFFQAVNFGKVFFIDSDNKVLDWINTAQTSGSEILEVSGMPFNTAYVICNLDNRSPTYWKGTSKTVEEYDKLITNTIWNGKKIVWYGTSISAGGYIGANNGNAIPQKVGEILGANVINEAIGSSCVHCKIPSRIDASTNPYGFYQNFEKVSRCLTNSETEMQWVINHWNTPGLWTTGTVSEMTEELAAQILANSYETKVDAYLTAQTFPDLFVIEHGYNDMWNSKTEQDELYETYGDEKIYSFRSGMDFIIKRILDYNPRAKIVLIGNYTAYGITGQTGDVPIMQEVVQDSWNLPMLKQWERLGWTTAKTIDPKGYWSNSGGAWAWVEDTSTHNMTVLNAWLPDGVHPHTDPTGKATKKIAEEIAAYLKNEISAT